MDIIELMKCAPSAADRETTKLRLNFEALCWESLCLDATNSDDRERTRIENELESASNQIHWLDASSVDNLRAKATVAYGWAKTKDGAIDVGNLHSAVGFDALAVTFARSFKTNLDEFHRMLGTDFASAHEFAHRQLLNSLQAILEIHKWESDESASSTISQSAL